MSDRRTNVQTPLLWIIFFLFFCVRSPATLNKKKGFYEVDDDEDDGDFVIKIMKIIRKS